MGCPPGWSFNRSSPCEENLITQAQMNIADSVTTQPHPTAPPPPPTTYSNIYRGASMGASMALGACTCSLLVGCEGCWAQAGYPGAPTKVFVYRGGEMSLNYMTDQKAVNGRRAGHLGAAVLLELPSNPRRFVVVHRVEKSVPAATASKRRCC